MRHLTRRSALTVMAAAAATATAEAQQAGAPPVIPFRFEDVARRARDLAATPYDGSVAPLPDPIANLDFDAYRDIRFRPERSLLNVPGRPFRMQLFHLGFLYTRPITVNVIRDGVPTPVPYQPQLFDFGRTKIERPLPVNLGFAGFRIHYPAQQPEGPRRADRVPGRELLPLPVARAAIRHLGARPVGQRAGERAGGVPVLPRVLDRRAGAGRRADHDLRPARQPLGRRRLPVRGLSRPTRRRSRSRRRSFRAGRSRPSGSRRSRPCTSRARTSAARATISGPSCTIRTGSSCTCRRANGCGGRSATRARRPPPPGATPTRAASA